MSTMLPEGDSDTFDSGFDDLESAPVHHYARRIEMGRYQRPMAHRGYSRKHNRAVNWLLATLGILVLCGLSMVGAALLQAGGFIR